MTNRCELAVKESPKATTLPTVLEEYGAEVDDDPLEPLDPLEPDEPEELEDPEDPEESAEPPPDDGRSAATATGEAARAEKARARATSGARAVGRRRDSRTAEFS